MPNELIFSGRSVLNGSLSQSDNNAISFTIKTKKGFFGKRKVTTLQTPNGKVAGRIVWKNKAIEVGGKKRDVKDVMRKPKMFSWTTREWIWSHHRYTVAYKRGVWTATNTSHKSTEATFTRHHYRLFRKNSPGKLEISPHLSGNEYVFMVLVMIYMETIRLQRNKTAADTTEGAADLLGALSG